MNYLKLALLTSAVCISQSVDATSVTFTITNNASKTMEYASWLPTEQNVINEMVEPEEGPVNVISGTLKKGETVSETRDIAPQSLEIEAYPKINGSGETQAHTLTINIPQVKAVTYTITITDKRLNLDSTTHQKAALTAVKKEKKGRGNKKSWN